jgi:hypothetical protein
VSIAATFSSKIIIITLILIVCWPSMLGGREGWMLPAYKPGSVRVLPRDGHFSRSVVTHALEQPTRSVLIGTGRPSLPIWPCSHWGLPCHRCYHLRGELLPHRFTLACTRRTGSSAVCSLLHFPSRQCLAQALPGSVPCGARTFLECLRIRDHPADSIHLQDTSIDR